MEKAEYESEIDYLQGQLHITGHRGIGVLEKRRDFLLNGVKFFPENSLASFRKAIELGVPAIECDIHVSKDFKAIVVHGSKLLSYSDFIGQETGKQIEHETEKLTAIEIGSNYALKGSDEDFDKKNREEKKKIIENKEEFQKVLAKKKESHRSNPKFYKIPTLEEMLNLVVNANKENSIKGNPLVKINIELKGKHSGLASMRTIKSFYEQNSENIKFLPPENLIFLGRREIGEICVVNTIVNKSDSGNIKDAIFNERYAQYEEDFDSLMRKNLLDKKSTTTKEKNITPEEVNEYIKEESDYNEAVRVSENISRLFKDLDYSSLLYGQECQLLTIAFVKAGGNCQSLIKMLLADPKEPFDDTKIPKNLRSELEKIANLSKEELKAKSTEYLKNFPKSKDLLRINNYIFNNSKNSTQPIQSRQAPLESDYKKAFMKSTFKKLQLDVQFTDQVKLYMKEDEGKTKASPSEQEKFLQNYSTSLQGVRTNIMLTTGQLFSSEAVNLKSGDFDIRSKFKDISDSGKELLRSSIIDSKYNGIDCSIYDINDEFIDIFNEAIKESGKKPNNFSLGLTASNWKGSKKENSPIKIDFTIAKGKIIANQTRVDVLLKYDEPHTALLVEKMLKSGDISELKTLEDFGIQDVDVGFVKAFAFLQDQYSKVYLERNNLKPPREEEKRFGLDIYSPEALLESERVQKAFKESFKVGEVPAFNVEDFDKVVQKASDADSGLKERMIRNLVYDSLLSEEDIEHEIDTQRQTSLELFRLCSKAYKFSRSVNEYTSQYKTLYDRLTRSLPGKSENTIQSDLQTSETCLSLPTQIDFGRLESFEHGSLSGGSRNLNQMKSNLQKSKISETSETCLSLPTQIDFGRLESFEHGSIGSIPDNKEEGFDFFQCDAILSEQVKGEIYKIVDNVTSGTEDDLAESAKPPANLQKGQGFNR